MSDAEGIDPDSVDWGSDGPRQIDEPALTVYPDLDSRINAAADRAFFEDVDQLDAGVDHDNGLLVLDPGGDRRPLTISREGGRGGDISTASRLASLLGDDAVEESQQVDLVERGEFIVADVSALDQSASDDDPDEPVDKTDSDGSEPEPEPEPEGESDESVQESVDDAAATDDTPEDGDTGEGSADGHATTQPAVEDYLFEAVRDGDRRFKSKKIAAELDGVGSRAVASCMTQLREADVPVVVTKEESDDPSEGAWWVVTPEAEVETDDGPAVLDLSSYTNDLSKLRVQNAITGATNVLDVQKNLSLPREEVAEILQTLGLYADLNAGRSAVEQHEIRSALRGVEVRD